MKDKEFVCELRTRVNKIRLKLSVFTLGFDYQQMAAIFELKQV